MTIGKKIAFFRKKAGMTQKKLSELSGVSEISIRKYEAGDRNPKQNQIKKLARAMEITEALFSDSQVRTDYFQTVGDFMKGYFELKNKMDIKLVTVKDIDENDNEIEKTAVIFENATILENLQGLELFQRYIDTSKKDIRENPDTEEAQKHWSALNEETILLGTLMRKRMMAQEEPLVDCLKFVRDLTDEE
ncbi:MAG: helix-turn-helix transcriptional regulator [Eubacteriales bacterium]